MMKYELTPGMQLQLSETQPLTTVPMATVVVRQEFLDHSPLWFTTLEPEHCLSNAPSPRYYEQLLAEQSQRLPPIDNC